MKIVFLIVISLLIYSCSDFELPSKEEVKQKAIEKVSELGLDKYKEKIKSLKESISLEELESLKSELQGTIKLRDFRVWRWFVEIDELVKSDSIDQAYGKISSLSNLENVKEYEKDLLKYVGIAIDNKTGKSDIPILK